MTTPKTHLRRTVVFLLLTYSVNLDTAGAAGNLALFLDTYQCALINQIRLIHENRSEARNRFIMLSTDQGQRYVQCLFLEDDSKALCEASSGYYGPRSGEEQTFRVGQRGLESLARLGFSIDASEGNYQRVFEPPSSEDFRLIASVILAALYEVYDADTARGLWVRAPLGEPQSLVPAQCLPTS